MIRSDAHTVGAWMTPSPHTIAFDATLAAAEAMMAEYGIRHLPVTRDAQVVGVLSERDIQAVARLSPDDGMAVRVAEAMTPIPYAVPPSMPLSRAARTMMRNRYGCAVVTGETDDRVLGVFSVVDALRALATLLERP